MTEPIRSPPDMYLSRLELHGFKSFADRTVVDFSPGITVVVGPNGCGKSNIVDAIRWVIGEQRARILRSEKMDNVIFNGTSNRRSLGMSEVLLTIENTRGILPIEYGEVTIGRRLFRSGESEYLLNGVQCRLKDITDLFMDTGMGAGAYSVIELKMIEDILSENAQDRRHMFEEAAGITKYKIRRNQALRKLESTRTDVDRVRDLVEELDRRVDSLQRQAQRASRFKALDDRLNHLIRSLAVRDFHELSGEDLELEKTLTLLGDQLAASSASLAEEEAAHEAHRKDHVEKEQALVGCQTALANHVEMLRSAETDLRLNAERRERIDHDLARARDEEERAASRGMALAADLERAALDLDAVRPLVETTRSRLDEVREKRDAIQKTLTAGRERRLRLLAAERRAAEELADRTTRIERLSSKVELLDAELQESETDRVDMAERLERLDHQVKSAVDVLEAARAGRDDAEDLLVRAREKRETHRARLQEAEADMHRLERQMDAADAEIALLESILSSYEEFSDAVRFLADSNDWSEEDVLTVADVLSCDDAVRLAVDEALGPFASCLVVRTEAAASAAMSRLRDEDRGRASFVILDRLSKKSKGEATPETPVEGAVPLASLVRPAYDEHAGLIDALLGSCFLVADLEAVERSSPDVGRYFTPAGEWYDAIGLRYGGGAPHGPTPAANRISRREQLDALRSSRDETTRNLEKVREAVVEAGSVVASLPVDHLEAELQRRESAVVEAEKQLSRVTYEREIMRRRRDEIGTRLEQLAASRSSAVEAAARLTDGLTELKETATSSAEEIRGIEEDLARDEAAGNAIFAAFNEADIAALRARHRLETVIQEEKRANEDLKALTAEAAERDARVEALIGEQEESTTASGALEIELMYLRERRGELDRAVSEAKDALMAVKVTISELEARLRDLRRDREQKIAEESRLSVRRAEISTRLDDLVQTMAEDYEIDLHVFEYEVEADLDTKTARAEIAEIRSKIRNLGPINALALESFEGERERLEFLTKQLADLEHAELTLKTTIDEINETASKRFATTFDAIQQNFQGLFKELFGSEASAEIVLENQDDPLETPIEILAKPSGKRPSVLAQLSGGEKTLTAIALLFSIYLVKPSPFCILDEVDAPLDDANIDRFMHLIRTFSESTQFVLVTHNKRTMEAADRMYGITMQEQGVSSLVGVKFERELPLVA